MGAGRCGVRLARAVAALAVCAFDATITVMSDGGDGGHESVGPGLPPRDSAIILSASATMVAGARVVDRRHESASSGRATRRGRRPRLHELAERDPLDRRGA